MPVINVVTEDVDLSGADYVPEPQAEHIMRVENLVVDAEGWPVTPPGLARASTSGALSAQPAQQAATHFVAQAPQSASAQTHDFASVFPHATTSSNLIFGSTTQSPVSANLFF